MCCPVRNHLRDFAELKTNHIKQMNRRFIQKSAGNIRIARPFRILQLAAIHLDMRRMNFIFRNNSLNFT